MLTKTSFLNKSIFLSGTIIAFAGYVLFIISLMLWIIDEFFDLKYLSSDTFESNDYIFFMLSSLVIRAFGLMIIAISNILNWFGRKPIK